MINKRQLRLIAAMLQIPLLLAGCGGGGGGGGGGTTTTTPTTLTVNELLFAQTHVIPKQGLSWKLKGKSESLALIAHRDALVLISFAQPQPQQPQLQVWINQTQVGTLPLQPPSALPTTEANGPAFRSNSYSATIPKQWVKPGLDLKVSASNVATSGFLGPIKVDVDADFTVTVLPFYLYGAAPGIKGSPTLTTAQQPTAAQRQEMFAKWPVATLNIRTHATGKVQWPYMIITPRVGHAAYRARTKNDQIDGFDTMDAVLGILNALRDANGDWPLANTYYAPLMMADNTGAYSAPGGGLAGTGHGTGDHLFSAIYIHEMGHTFGLPHQGSAYTAGNYPYANGSLAGSAWGFDQNRQQFLAPFVPATAPRYNNCQTNPVNRQLDNQGRCIKQDPMQGGDGDQAAGYQYATFSDFSTAQMQAYLRSKAFVDANFSTGYSQWDSATQQRVAVSTATTKSALYGLNSGFPVQKNVPVYSIIITLSHAPCSAANPQSQCNAANVDTNISQIYPPLAYTGNLRATIDPTKPADLAAIDPNGTGNYHWFCQRNGCDYTLRVTYSDNSRYHVLLQHSFRPWFNPTGTPATTTTDPKNGNSLRIWGVNIPAGKTIAKIELLHTPMGWNGIPLNPTVLLVR